MCIFLVDVHRDHRDRTILGCRGMKECRISWDLASGN